MFSFSRYAKILLLLTSTSPISLSLESRLLERVKTISNLQVEETRYQYKQTEEEATKYIQMILLLKKESGQSDGYLEASWTIRVTILLPV